jgi:hypothetical protein
MRNAIVVTLGLVLAFGIAGCDDDKEPIGAGERTTSDERAMPPDHPPISAEGKKLRWTLPEGWSAVEPTSNFQYARLTLPLAAEDRKEGAEAVLTVNWTPRGLGGLDSNLVRWAGMVTKKDGNPATRADADIKTRAVHGLKVTTLVVSGTYGAGMMGGPHATGDVENATLFAAYVDVPGAAPYYVKAVGPAATMTALRADLEKFIDSLHLQ